jgi:L-asparagine transporter-like permease
MDSKTPGVCCALCVVWTVLCLALSWKSKRKIFKIIFHEDSYLLLCHIISEYYHLLQCHVSYYRLGHRLSNEYQVCINFINFMSLLSNLYILLATSLDLWSNFQEKLAEETAVSSANCEVSDIIAVRCTFGNAWVCYDVNTEFTKLKTISESDCPPL